MGPSRPRDCVCRCNLASLQSNEVVSTTKFSCKGMLTFLGKKRKQPRHALGYYSDSTGDGSDSLRVQESRA